MSQQSRTKVGTNRLTYRRTHPWLTFSVDLHTAPPAFWMALGEARSKCQHLAGVPLKPDSANLLHQIFLARGALATTAIEGNTLSEKQALDVVQQKSDLPESQRYLAQEIQNIIDASNGILTAIQSGILSPLSVQDIKEYNKLVLRGLAVAPHVIPGECVKLDVAVAGYHGAPWQECDELLQRLVDWLNGDDFTERDGDGISTGILRAVVGHLYLVWIHPFGDGNGRTARLMEARFLMEAGVPSAAAHLLSNFYNRTRSDYYRRLKEASQSTHGVLAFLSYAVNGFIEELRQQIKFVKQQHWNVSWENYVYELFDDQNTVADKRQRALALALAKFRIPVPRVTLRMLSAEIATYYANKSPKTLTRDLNALVERGLIVKTSDGYRAAVDKLLAFLPTSKRESLAAQMMDQGFRPSDITDQLDFKL